MQWFEYPICVPFGNPNYDSGLGGSHDMDVQCPPNMPVTALLDGIITDISAPSWGKQVCLKLDNPYNGVGYMGYLHLSAVNPDLQFYQHIKAGDLLGWVGGAYQDAQFLGTVNPTGQNFLNTPQMSSQVQVGVALMRGPAYGVGMGWTQFPPIDFSLDPTPIILQARANLANPAPTPTQPPTPKPIGMQKDMAIVWGAYQNALIAYLQSINLKPPVNTGISMHTGIGDVYQKLYSQYCLGPVITPEYETTDWNNYPIIKQHFMYGTVTWYKGSGKARIWTANGVEITGWIEQ